LLLETKDVILCINLVIFAVKERARDAFDENVASCTRDIALTVVSESHREWYGSYLAVSGVEVVLQDDDSAGLLEKLNANDFILSVAEGELFSSLELILDKSCIILSVKLHPVVLFRKFNGLIGVDIVEEVAGKHGLTEHDSGQVDLPVCEVLWERLELGKCRANQSTAENLNLSKLLSRVHVESLSHISGLINWVLGIFVFEVKNVPFKRLIVFIGVECNGWNHWQREIVSA